MFPRRPWLTVRSGCGTTPQRRGEGKEIEVAVTRAWVAAACSLRFLAGYQRPKLLGRPCLLLAIWLGGRRPAWFAMVAGPVLMRESCAPRHSPRLGLGIRCGSHQECESKCKLGHCHLLLSIGGGGE